MIQQRSKIKSYNQMLAAYESSCIKIKQRYTNDMNKFTQDSVKILSQLFQSYQEKKRLIEVCQQTQINSTQQSTNKKHNFVNKIFQEDNFYCTSYQKKTLKNNQKQNNKEKQNYVLAKHLHKLNLGSNCLDVEPEVQQQQQDSPTKKIQKFNQLNNKNLAQIIQESQKKISKKFQQSNTDQMDLLLLDESSDYQITEYSSNQSSNDGSYSPYYAEEIQTKPLFGGMFSKTMSSDSNFSQNSKSNSNLLNFNFSSKQLLKSPKKLTKSKRSRMYVRAKKIPRWAEDLQEVQRICAKQDVQATSIFGKCVVEHLDTNVIFQDKKQTIQRTSSAKWNNQIFLT